jgi:hypothetical protein
MVWLAMQLNLSPSWVLANDDGKYRHIEPFSVVMRLNGCVRHVTAEMKWPPADHNYMPTDRKYRKAAVHTIVFLIFSGIIYICIMPIIDINP